MLSIRYFVACKTLGSRYCGEETPIHYHGKGGTQREFKFGWEGADGPTERFGAVSHLWSVSNNLYLGLVWKLSKKWSSVLQSLVDSYV